MTCLPLRLVFIDHLAPVSRGPARFRTIIAFYMTARSVVTCATAIALAVGLSATGSMQSQQSSTPPPGAAGAEDLAAADNTLWMKM